MDNFILISLICSFQLETTELYWQKLLRCPRTVTYLENTDSDNCSHFEMSALRGSDLGRWQAESSSPCTCPSVYEGRLPVHSVAHSTERFSLLTSFSFQRSLFFQCFIAYFSFAPCREHVTPFAMFWDAFILVRPCCQNIYTVKLIWKI
jgi:hypothetical protein